MCILSNGQQGCSTAVDRPRACHTERRGSQKEKNKHGILKHTCKLVETVQMNLFAGQEHSHRPRGQACGHGEGKRRVG